VPNREFFWTVSQFALSAESAHASGQLKIAVGHASLLTTSVYLHVVVDEREEVEELFAAINW
jgi:hypothetical protein